MGHESIAFTVPGRPVPKGRPRFNRRTGNAYTPAKTREYEKLVATKAAEAAIGRELPLTGPVAVQLTFDYTKGAMLARVKLLPASPLQSWHTARPDIDNVTKAILDGISKAGLLSDDAQVCFLCVSKIKRGGA